MHAFKRGGRLTVEDAAYCAAAWASGVKQQSLARSYGLKTPAMVSLAIREFLNNYADPAAVQALSPAPGLYQPIPRTGEPLYNNMIYGTERKTLVKQALENFQRARAHGNRS